MFNNRAYINELKSKIELLEKNIESKENTVCNLLEANKELSQHNNFLANRNITLNAVNRKLKEIIKKHEENECRLNTELSKATGKLDKVKNAYRMLTGEELK